MSDQTSATTAVIGATFAVICCAGPLLLVALVSALGTAGLTGWLTNSVYVLIPVLLISLGGLWFHRRRAAAQACCDPAAPEQGTKS